VEDEVTILPSIEEINPFFEIAFHQSGLEDLIIDYNIIIKP